MQPGGYLLLKRLGLAHCCEGIGAQKVGMKRRLGGRAATGVKLSSHLQVGSGQQAAHR